MYSFIIHGMIKFYIYSITSSYELFFLFHPIETNCVSEENSVLFYIQFVEQKTFLGVSKSLREGAFIIGLINIA